MQGGSAVLLYPADDSSSSNDSRRWQTCFIDQGKQTPGQIALGNFIISAAMPSQENFIVLPANALNANLIQLIEQAIVLHQASLKTRPQAKAQPQSELLIKDVEDTILDYLDNDIGSTANYKITRGSIFLDKKLPIAALLRHVIRGEQAQAEAMINLDSAVEPHSTV